MQFNKTILLTVLGISLYGSVMAMLEGVQLVETPEGRYVFLAPKTSKNQAFYLAQFATQDNYDERELAFKVAQWLVCKRKDNVENYSWNEFMDMFVFHLKESRCTCDCVRQKKLDAVVGVVKEIAYGFKPGEDCSQLLVDRAVEELKKLGQ